KRVLCLCSAGLLRSPTAANVLHQEFGFNTRAAGVTPEFALIPLDPLLIRWAEETVCVEQSVYDASRDSHNDILEDKRVVVLAIPDQYDWNDPDLRNLIKKQYEDSLIMEKAKK